MKYESEYYTPKWVFDALNVNFDTDVASPKDKTFLHVPAANFIHENSLVKKWEGFVWMNPPYENQENKINWINKFIEHGDGIALMPDRTSTEWWHILAKKCDSTFIINRKISFIRSNGTIAGQPTNGTTLFGIGLQAHNALLNAENAGIGIYINKLHYGEDK